MDTTTGGAPGGPHPAAPSGGRVLHPVEAIVGGWNAFAARPWPSLGVLLVLFAILCACGLIPLVNLIAAALVSPALYAGGAWFFLRGVRCENPPFESAFEGFQRWPSVTGAVWLAGTVSFLISLPLIVTALVALGFAALVSARSGHLPDLAGLGTVPTGLVALVTYPVLFWWHARSGMVFFTAMEPDRPSPREALRRSLALTKGSVWRIIGLALLWVPVALAGLVALCVGLLPASAVIYYSFAHAYEQLRERASGGA